jgi:peroxiredoxin
MTNINTYGQALPASLPQSSLLDTNGNTVNPRDQIRTAPVTLLVFFATYDTPWSDNVKIAKQVNQDMTKDGVRVIAIDEEETQGTVTAFVATEGLTFTVLRDKDGSFLRPIGTPHGVEQMILVDNSGNILARPEGKSDSIAAIKEALRGQGKH